MKQTDFPAKHSGLRTDSGPFLVLGRRVPLATAAACALLLALAVPPAHGLRLNPRPGCDDLCSKEFWLRADASDVADALVREPATMSYRSHVLRLAVLIGAEAGAVEALLRAGAPPNAREETNDRRYVLQVAVLLGTEESDSERWRQRGGDDDERESRRTREREASRSPGIVSALLAAGADPDGRDESGLTAADLARRHGNDAALALLLSPSDPPPPCGPLCTAEFWTRTGPEEVRTVLAQTGTARGRSSRGDTPLHLALEAAADAGLVTRLLEAGADPNARNARDDTPLHVAAGIVGGATAIAVLLEHGAVLEAANTRDRTPLYVASKHAATLESMRALLEAGADPDIRGGERAEMSPRELAARQREGAQATRLLLDYGDQASAASAIGLEPLLHHAAIGHPDTVTLLLDRGADVHQQSPFGQTAILNAAAAGNLATTRVLLARGADANWSKYDGPAVLSGEGERPLHVAVHSLEVVELLLEHGADPDGRMYFTGETPLHLAAASCETESIALLLARGANPNLQDEHGDTPLSRAVKRVANSGQVEWEAWWESCATNRDWESPGQCREAARRDFERQYERREECEDNVSTLMRHGARTDIPGYGGYPPLEQARRLGLVTEALRWYREGVERGADDAQFNLGVLYARGEGVREDEAEAARLLRLAAEQGHPGAQFNLGGLYARGEGVPHDDAQAGRWYRLAAKQGLQAAREKLERMRAGEAAGPEDDAEAVRRIHLAAEGGDVEAQFNLGIMYNHGEGVPEDDAEAVHWYRLAAEQGHAEAQFHLGFMHDNGKGVPENDAEAVRWYRLAAKQGLGSAHHKIGRFDHDDEEDSPEDDAARDVRLAAERGDVEAQLDLGYMHLYGEGVPEDLAEAARWIRLAAERGHAMAQYLLGIVHDHGIGVPQDFAEAMRWYRLAAKQGDTDAMLNLGLKYGRGEGVPEDLAEAARWIRLAAERGHAMAQYKLGLMHVHGEGVLKDLAEAMRWYRRAAEQGDADAMNDLGIMYALGEGVPEDDAEAVSWFRDAAGRGNAHAQFNLGRMYANGEGLPEDLVEAFAWLRAAEEQGLPGAKEERELVASHMGDDQTARARKLWRSYWTRYVARFMD